jgi:hypothetical protein
VINSAATVSLAKAASLANPGATDSPAKLASRPVKAAANKTVKPVR